MFKWKIWKLVVKVTLGQKRVQLVVEEFPKKFVRMSYL